MNDASFAAEKPVSPDRAVDALVAERMGVPLSALTRETVEAYQLEAFRRTLRYARENSDFYRTALADAEPEASRTMEDIRRLPFTTEDDLAEHEWRFQCVGSSAVERNVTVPTTGTRGKRKRLSFSAEDQQRAVDFIYRGFVTMRCAPGEKMLILMSGTSAGSIGDLVKRAMAPLAMDIDVFGSVTDIPAAYERLMAFRPGVVEAIPWHAAALARYGARFGNPERAFIRSVNLSADVVPDAIVSRLERLWGCSVHRHYGSTEMCIFGGVECTHHRGYHLRPCDILYEIPEPDENGLGEIVITTLDREAMPLIRYRTGDIGRFEDEPCRCGCLLRRLWRVYGRESSRIPFGKTAVFLSDLADALYKTDAVIDFDLAADRMRRLRFTVRTLPGERAEAREIEENVLAVPGVRETVTAGEGELSFVFEETDSFPSGYNLKKTVAVLPSEGP